MSIYFHEKPETNEKECKNGEKHMGSKIKKKIIESIDSL